MKNYNKSKLAPINTLVAPHSVRKQSGFTLIELLVVVLIIGILASVALPQYNKAVRKARLSEVATTFSALSKAIDMYILGSDYPASGGIYLSGTGKVANLDIDIPCATEDEHTCYTKIGRWTYQCWGSSGYGGASCTIGLSTNYNADKTTGNKWLDNFAFTWVKSPNRQEWGLDSMNVLSANASTKSEICRWWKGIYGSNRVVSMGGSGISSSSACDAY